MQITKDKILEHGEKLANEFQSQPNKQGAECMFGYARTAYNESWSACLELLWPLVEVSQETNKIPEGFNEKSTLRDAFKIFSLKLSHTQNALSTLEAKLKCK